jgi:hypothetical protein
MQLDIFNSVPQRGPTEHLEVSSDVQKHITEDQNFDKIQTLRFKYKRTSFKWTRISTKDRIWDWNKKVCQESYQSESLTIGAPLKVNRLSKNLDKSRNTT